MSTIIKKQRRRQATSVVSLPQGSWFEFEERLYFLPETDEICSKGWAFVVDLSSGHLVQISEDAKVLPVTSVTLEIQP